MKKLALTIAIVLGLGITTFAQAEYYGQEEIANDGGLFGYGVSIFDKKGNLALFADISQYERAVEEDTYGNEYGYEYGYQGEGGLFGFGATGLFYRPRGTGFFVNLPDFGATEDQDAPLGSGIAVLMGLGAAYLVAKKRKED